MKNICIKSVLLIMGLFIINNFSLEAQDYDDRDIIEQDYENRYTEVLEEVYLFNEIDYAFYQSYNAFLDGQDGTSAARLKRAVYFVRAEAADAKSHNRKPIENQANRLMSLADSVGMGHIHSAHRLRRAFARTHHVLAKDYKLRASAAWVGKEAKATGHAMRMSVGYLGHAARWSGEKIEDGAVATGKGIGKAGKGTYRGTRWLAGKMIKGVAFVPEKVGQSLEWLGKGIAKVGDKVEPKSAKDKVGDSVIPKSKKRKG